MTTICSIDDTYYFTFRIFSPVDHPADVGNDVTGGEVGGVGGPSGSDSITAVDKDEGDDGHVESGLDGEAVVVEVGEEVIVVRVEDGAGNLLNLGEDVTRRSGVLSSHAAGTELTRGGEEVDVVGTGEGLGHSDDGSGEGHLRRARRQAKRRKKGWNEMRHCY